MVQSARGNRSDGMEYLPDGLRDSRGRGEKEGTPKKGKKGQKSEIIGLKSSKMDGKDAK